jgi:hypothetical protein
MISPFNPTIDPGSAERIARLMDGRLIASASIRALGELDPRGAARLMTGQATEAEEERAWRMGVERLARELGLKARQRTAQEI